MKFLIILIFIPLLSHANNINILMLDTGIDLSHDFFKSENIVIKQDRNEIIKDDHGTHLACILLKDIKDKSISLHSINYRNKNIGYIKKYVKKVKFDFVLYSSGEYDYNQAEDDILNFIINKNKNVKIIISAGNNSQNINNKKYYPCELSKKYSQIKCIGNSSNYSNYGDHVIKYNSPHEYESCTFKNKYIIKKGTSQAAAFYLNNIIKN